MCSGFAEVAKYLTTASSRARPPAVPSGVGRWGAASRPFKRSSKTSRSCSRASSILSESSCCCRWRTSLRQREISGSSRIALTLYIPVATLSSGRKFPRSLPLPSEGFDEYLRYALVIGAPYYPHSAGEAPLELALPLDVVANAAVVVRNLNHAPVEARLRRIRAHGNASSGQPDAVLSLPPKSQLSRDLWKRGPGRRSTPCHSDKPLPLTDTWDLDTGTARGTGSADRRRTVCTRRPRRPPSAGPLKGRATSGSSRAAGRDEFAVTGLALTPWD